MNSTHAQPSLHNLQAGDADYQPIIDVAQPAVQTALGIPVQLKVEQLRSSGDWAFLLALMRSPEGDRLDLSGTPYAEHAEAGSFSDVYAALLRRKDEGWTIVTTVIGPGDLAWANWSAEHGAPSALFRGD